MSTGKHRGRGPGQEERSAEQVADYLRRHPDFLMQHPALVAALRFASTTDGKVVSLAEKQAEVLRERNLEIRQRMGEALETARRNELLFENTRRLSLDLMEAESMEDIIAILHNSLRHDFSSDTSSLILFGDPTEETCARVAELEQAQALIPGILRAPQPVCGLLREEELEFLFPANREVGSATAAVLLQGDKALGVLAIGSYDPEYFRSEMGTVFLGYIRDVLCRVLPRFFPANS